MSESARPEDHVTAFRDAMAKEGIHYSGPIEADGQFHRVAHNDAPRGKRDVWYKVFLDDRPAGMFGWNRLGNETKFTWSAKGLAPLTPEARADLARRAAEAKAKAAAEETARHEAAKTAAAGMWEAASESPTHPYLARKGVQAHGGLRVGPWVKQRKDGSSYTLCPNALLIPMVAAKGEIWGLQAIFPEKIEISGEQRDKDFIYGAVKKGLYHTIGAPGPVDDVLTIGLCEGYATGASVHEATGIGVLACFDAGNLVHVARKLRAARPAARLVIFADNDQFTVIRDVPVNTGVLKGKEAADTVGGILIVPQFADLATKPNDWNDLANLAGDKEVARQIWAVLRPQANLPAVVEEPPPVESAESYGEFAPAAPEGDLGESKPKKERRQRKAGEGGNPDAVKVNGWFTILGHDRDSIYAYQHEKRMIICRGASDWSENALLTLAPAEFWEAFSGSKGKIQKTWCADAVIRHAYEKGYFDPTTTRGRGAWLDEGRIVVHLGHRLMVNGEEMDVTDIESNYVYEQGRRLRLPHATPLSAADGRKIIETAKVFHWNRPASAILCAGWVALAPLCGALRWRPHIWLTGGAGSGKSSILNHFIWPLMHGMEIYAQGNSTEPGIRQTLMTDALPVLFEETEQNDERERLRMQGVLSLIRQSSTESGARTLKGSQTGDAMGFMVRSMFCLASIQVGIRHQADAERIAVLALRPKRTANKDQAAKNWAIIKAAVDELAADKELPGRLLRRSIMLLPTTLQNCEIFAKAAADKFGSQREGDQYGIMLAGAWSLVKSTVATPEEARDMISRYDWTEYTESSEQEESSKALQTLLERPIRTQRGDVSVYELVARCAGLDGPGAWDGAKDTAEALLRRHGMMLKWNGKLSADAALLVAYNHSELDQLMSDTPYASDVKGQLLRVNGAFRHAPERFNGTLSRSVGIPLSMILDGAAPAPDYGDDLDLAF
jgi:putative DNA primase/helicase